MASLKGVDGDLIMKCDKDGIAVHVRSAQHVVISANGLERATACHSAVSAVGDAPRLL